MKGQSAIHTILLVLLLQNAFGQQEVFDYPMEESSLLWEISGNEIPEGSYLFGTMHIMEPAYYFYPDTLTSILKNSDLLITEINESLFDPKLMQLLFLEQGSFFDYFNQEQEDSLLNWGLEKLSMDADMFRMSFGMMKPFVFAQFAAMLDLGEETLSYELEFQELAQESEIAIEGLESVEDQVGLFDSLSKAQQAEMVMASIRENGNDENTDEMQQLYIRQHVDSLYMYILDENSVISENANTFLIERNKNWVPKIAEAIETKKCFIAVGAGHLGGPDGLIRLLQKEGYELKSVKL